MALVLSYDEKPEIQAIATAGEALLPDSDYGAIKRDYEYKRLGAAKKIAILI